MVAVEVRQGTLGTAGRSEVRQGTLRPDGRLCSAGPAGNTGHDGSRLRADSTTKRKEGRRRKEGGREKEKETADGWGTIISIMDTKRKQNHHPPPPKKKKTSNI